MSHLLNQEIFVDSYNWIMVVANKTEILALVFPNDKKKLDENNELG